MDPVKGLAYMASHEFGLAIVDVSNPAAPWIVSTLDTPAAAGSRLYVLDGALFEAIDVTNPAAPGF